MKKIMTTVLMIFVGAMLFGQSYNVTLNGSVFDEDTGQPMVQTQVWIYTDSIGDFSYYNNVFTGGDGTFSDNFDMPGNNEGTLYVSTSNCDGSMVTEVISFSVNHSDLEVVLLVCGNPSGGDCQAMFEYYPSDNDWLTIQFTDESFGYPSTWDWDFGDGHLSAQQNPLHTFSEMGKYLVSLTISDDSLDCTSSFELLVYVTDSIWFPDSCLSMFSAYPDSMDFLTMHFVDMSITQNGNPPTNWQWSFGDGTGSSEQNPSHTFAGEGSYEVCLFIFNDDQSCQSEYCTTIEIIDWDSYCQAQFNYYQFDSLVGYGIGVQFTDYSYGNPTSWSWDFGDGESSVEQNPLHIYTGFGAYAVCLTIANPEDSCESTFCHDVYVFNDTLPDCIGWFNYEIDELTVDFTGYLENSQSGEYTWHFGDGTTGTGQTVSNIYTVEGSYVVTMTVEDSLSDCYITYTHMIWVGDVSFDISGYVHLDDSLLMADDAYVYLITFDTVAGELINIAETGINDYGYYVFDDVSDDNYIYYVQAELTEDSEYFGGYAPTYHHSAIYWQDASPVFPYPAGYNYDIHLVPLQTMKTGLGLIEGTVGYETEREMLEDVNVLLLDVDKNPYTYNKTGVSGEFVFSNLAFGTYVVYTEIVGVTTLPATIELTEENREVTVNIVVANGEAVLGIGDDRSFYIDLIGNVYPNPITHNAFINVTLKQEATLKLTVLNNYGQIMSVAKNEFSTGSHKIDLKTEHLPKGIYFISIQAENGAALTRKLVKL